MLEIKDEARGLISHGVSACHGCGLEIVIRKVMDALDDDVIILIPPGCAALFSGYCKETNVKIPGYQGNLENTAASASGIRAALKAKGNDHTTVLCFCGDGATVDIGLQSLSGAFERNDKILYVCYDNEAYMNTGIQGSSSTPLFAATTTTPGGKKVRRKDLTQIAIAHNIPYVATASAHNVADLQKKVKKAREADGPALLHIYAPCPTGWRSNPAKTIEISRLAEQTGCWINFEYEDGKVTINSKVKELKPVEEYTKLQGRFKALTPEQKVALQEEVTSNYNATMKKLQFMSE